MDNINNYKPHCTGNNQAFIPTPVMRITPGPMHRRNDPWNTLHTSVDLLHRSHSAPCHQIMHQNMNITYLNDIITEDRCDTMLDVNCNDILLHDEDCLNHSRLSVASSSEDNSSRRNSCSRHTSNINLNKNKNSSNCQTFDDNDPRKRFTKYFQRSDSNPWTDDSGFSSCSCLYEDKDDSDNGLSIDRQHGVVIPALRRSRSYSLDSTSSDFSDCTDSHKLSSSLPSNYTYISQNAPHSGSNTSTTTTLPGHLLQSREDSQCKTDDSLAKTKLEHSQHKDCILFPSNEKRKPVKVRRPKPRHRSQEPRNDVNNNQQLASHKRISSLAPHRLFSVLQTNGLLALIGCILYTLGLIFLLGFASIVWSLLSSFVNQADLKEFRRNVVEKQRRRDVIARSVRDSAKSGPDTPRVR